MKGQAMAPATPFGDAVRVSGETVTVANAGALATPAMDALAREAVFGSEAARERARWLIWEIGQAVGVQPASIHDLYIARGRGETHGFTVPAINVRGAAYDTARAIFRAAIRRRAGAIIFEIARSEIAYTDQRPAEYVSVILAAAMREGFRGPVFIQGDHFQVNAKKFAADPAAEVNAVKQLATEAVTAGFYNIDVDTSTLVDIHKPTLDEQQRLNYETAADIATYVRSLEPAGVTISIGAEIGEVGTSNSTVPELQAFMDGYARTMRARGQGALAPLSKISVQTGTSHGGIVLPDGSIAEVKLDLAALEALSKVARDAYGMAGAVQHGASTLPDNAFNHFPRIETAEIHLATNFQNILYDHLPAELRARIYRWLDQNAKDERKATDSDEQFYYKTRKKALGPFKKELWDLPEGTKAALAAAYEKTFGFLFDQLKVGDTAAVVARTVKPPRQHHRAPTGALAPDDPDAGE
ncbi:MAG TPA: class II fructose-bisphosphate aldolase [Gemmatimonadaceae bacterium]|nr:class II fructose-bisphosphate aldolase [Gemmatimonadaceae bacterium]